MDKYALLRIFHNDLPLKVYMHDLIYVNPKKMSVEEYFQAPNIFLKATIKFQLQNQSCNIGFD